MLGPKKGQKTCQRSSWSHCLCVTVLGISGRSWRAALAKCAARLQFERCCCSLGRWRRGGASTACRLLSYVFELSVSRLEEVAPLARVSKLFNACVKRPNVLGGLELRTHERLQRLFPDLVNDGSVEDLRLTKAAASAELDATRQHHRPSTAVP